MHHRLAGQQRRRRDLPARDGVEDYGVFDWVEDLVCEHALLAGEHAVGCRELCADAWAFVILRPEQHALGHAHAKSNLVHEMLDEAGKSLRWTRRHHLDAVGVLEVTNHPDFGQLVLLLLPVRERERRIWLEEIARIRDASVVEDERGLLRGEAHARLLGLKDVMEHPRGLNRGVEICDSAVLVHPKWVEVMAELIRRNVLRAEINAVTRDSENPIRDRLAKVVCDDSLEIVVRRDCRVIRVADARRRHELELEPFAAATDYESAISVHRTLLGGELHELLEAVPVRHVARLAPRVKVLADLLVVVAITGRR